MMVGGAEEAGMEGQSQGRGKAGATTWSKQRFGNTLMVRHGPPGVIERTIQSLDARDLDCAICTAICALDKHGPSVCRGTIISTSSVFVDLPAYDAVMPTLTNLGSEVTKSPISSTALYSVFPCYEVVVKASFPRQIIGSTIEHAVLRELGQSNSNLLLALPDAAREKAHED